MRKIFLLFTPILFFSCDTKGDCGCEVFEIIVDEQGKETYKFIGNRSGYCSQYNDLEGYYFYDINCD